MRALSHVSADSHVANALVAYVRYLGKIFMPTRLAVFYPYNESLPDWQVFCCRDGVGGSHLAGYSGNGVKRSLFNS